ncbi:EF-hand calcium-binding domain-containing protein 12-like [Coregonus clupeaformis]|uniref:EF-hand calcium-binding domain-containing protein 12-like n=1 Tax=Coregonus clupeaformis TaxID=59861 RepID=UPI001E1C7ED5|nr:EF-hand calcium-binding domain-containing protein 12-like [Coregonus clupeaformis]
MEDLEIEEQLARIKKRDLFQTYFYKMASRVFGPAKTRDRVFIAPPMPKMPVCMPKPACQVPTKCRYGSVAVAAMVSGAGDRVSGAPMTVLPLEGNDAKHQDWVNQRRSFRRQFDSLGDLSKWVDSKPTVTELEMLVVEREKKKQKTPSPVPGFTLTPPEAHKARTRASPTRPSRWANVPRPSAVRSPLCKVKEVKRYCRTHKLRPSELAKRLDKHGTGLISRNDLRAVFEKEGIPVVPEHLDHLVSTLSGMEGDTVTVKDLAEGIKAWSLEREREESTSWGRRGLTERGELELEKGCNREIERVRGREQRFPSIPARKPVWSRGPKRGSGRHGAQLLPLPSPELCLQTPLSLEEQQEQARIQQHHRNRIKKGMQDEEVLAIMRTVCTGNPTQDAHSHPSSLGGDTAKAVDRFRRQCLGEYLDSLYQCHTQGVTVNQATLERVLLHPGDHVLGGPKCPVLRQAGSNPMPGCGGRLRTWIGYSGSTPRGGEEKEEEEHDLEEEAALHKVCKDTPLYPSHRSVRRGPKMMTLSTGRAEVRHKTECWLTREEYAHMTSNMREPSSCRADPNAFWPGQDNHVRLYLPRVGLSPEGVLFEHIIRSPAPSPGNWPVSDRGYSTSGDIDGHKAYTL